MTDFFCDKKVSMDSPNAQDKRAASAPVHHLVGLLGVDNHGVES